MKKIVLSIFALAVGLGSFAQWDETTKLLPSSEVESVAFGQVTAISNNRVIVGAPDGAIAYSGEVFIYEMVEGEWEETLLATGDMDWIGYGRAVDIDGDYAIFTSYGNVVKLFHYTEETGWEYEASLLPSDLDEGEYGFGSSVSLDIEGSRILVGFDGAHSSTGEAYVFKKGESGWFEEAKLIADDAMTGSYFGVSVALEGDRAVIGAMHDSEVETNGGAAYVFEYNEADDVWAQALKLQNDEIDVNDRFGNAVDIEGDNVLVGARTEAVILDGVSHYAAGTISLFELSFDVDDVLISTLTTKIENPAPEDNPQMGADVVLNGDYILASARYHDFDGVYHSGGLFIFKKTEDGYDAGTLIGASDMTFDAQFGAAVAMEDDMIVVGAVKADNAEGDETGAVYIFEYCAVEPVIFVYADELELCEAQETSLYAFGEIETVTWTPEIINGVSFIPPVGTTTYTVLGTDEDGCQGELPVEITVHPNDINPVAEITPTIDGDDGAIDLTITGGEPDFIIDWNIDGVGDFDDEEDLEGLSEGIYTVVIEDAVGCVASYSYLIDSQLGIDELSEVVNVYPNPATSNLTIELEGVYTYSIYNLSGALVQQGQGNDIETVDVSELTSGAYILQIVSNNETIQLNLVKQ